MGKPGKHKASTRSIRVTYFNQAVGTTSQTFNHWGEGICFQSVRRFEVGSTVLIRSCRGQRTFASNGPAPMNSLGVVTSCREIPGASPAIYEVKVRYFLPEY